jgi:Kef-type K+ transport system membrane component KefB
MASVAGTAAVVALVGVIVPFALGYLTATRVLGLGHLSALVCGAALTATSIGISARVLDDLRQLETREGQIVLAAAVLDDIIGLTILAVVTTIALGGSLSPSKVAFPAESALIVGSFGAGMILNATALRPTIDFVVTRIGYVLVPIFFASVGAAVVLSSFTEAHTLAAGGLLIGVGILGKFVAGFAPWRFKGNKTLIGVAMIPRGEVGLIFAQMGLATGAIDAPIFSALTLMVMVTTFLAPPLLAAVGKRSR